MNVPVSSMLITVIGLTLPLAICVQRHSVETPSDTAEARLYEQSSVELGLRVTGR